MSAAAIENIAEEAARLPEAGLKRIYAALESAQAEVAADLAKWLKLHKSDGASRFTAQKYRQTLLQLSKALEVVGKRLPAEMQKVLTAQGVLAAKKAHEHLVREVDAMMGKFPDTQAIDINQAAAIARANSLLVPRYRNSANRYGKDMTDEMRRQLAIGTLRGESFEELTNRLAKQGGPRGLVSLSGTLGEPGSYGEYIAEGLFAKYRHWAERIVRTEGMHAYNAQHQSALEEAEAEDPGYLKRWDATADKRICAVCRNLDGKTVAVDKEFPGGVMHPPVHPNDRCRITPWRSEWGETTPVTSPTKPVKPVHSEQVAQRVATNIAAKDYGAARVELLDMLEFRGMAVHSQDKKAATFVAKLPPNIRGYHAANGSVVISPIVAKQASKFGQEWQYDSAKVHLKLAKRASLRNRNPALPLSPIEREAMAVKTLVHEALHGCGPMKDNEYIGHGLIAEEVTTEVSARAVMQELYGYDRRVGTYQPYIDQTVRAMKEALGCDSDTALERLEEASLSMKTDGQPKASSISMRDRLARHIATASPAQNAIDNELTDGVSFQDGNPSTPHERVISDALAKYYGK
jgi:SPP1 gp7 family putative phage head morphogenesis protein